MTLEWKDIPEYEGYYQINNCGEIRNVRTNKKIKPFLNKYGYLQVTLCKNKKTKLFRVHRLVSLCFLPKVKGKELINHINGNKKDNRVENLEWCNASENIKHAYENKLQEPLIGKDNILSKVTYQYDINHNLIKVWESIGCISRELNIKKQYISACCLGKIKSTHGYIFKYSEECE